jgi:hypothetical protein
MNLERIDTTEWRRALPETGFEVFHTPAALEVLDEHARGDLTLFAGYKGDRPVALFPAKIQRRSAGTAVLSPPPGFGVPRLGPILMPASPKQRKRERLNRQFVTDLLETLDVDERSTLFRTICPTGYRDPRPFNWSGLRLETAFTYSLDTSGRSADEISDSFSKSLRRELRDARALDVAVTPGDAEDVRLVYEDAAARYEEAGEPLSLPWLYVRDLTAALATEDRCRTYVVRSPSDEFLSGLVVLYSNDAAYFWLGGTRTTYQDVSVNSLLHWRVITDLLTDPPRESTARYDLVGANTERLCRYKSKFNAELRPYYVVESDSRYLDLAKRAYELLGR